MKPECLVCLDERRVLIAEPGSMDSAPVPCPCCVWGLTVVVVDAR